MDYSQGCIPAVLVWMASGGCLDDSLTATPLPDGSAQTAFIWRVAPLLRSKCAGTSCHENGASPPFLGNVGQTDDYAAVLATTSMLGNFDVGAATMVLEITQGGHYTAVYTARDVELIGEWFALERGERGIP